MDKFMEYGNKGLRGAAVHNYRDEARSAPGAPGALGIHYDAGSKHPGHIHQNRILLKAQPQQGKTGCDSVAAHILSSAAEAWARMSHLHQMDHGVLGFLQASRASLCLLLLFFTLILILATFPSSPPSFSACTLLSCAAFCDIAGLSGLTLDLKHYQAL